MIAVTGLATLILEESGLIPPVAPFLKQRKTQKYLGLQDHLAVVCAGEALQQAALRDDQLGTRAGLFFVSGFIPFTSEDVEPVLQGSLVDGEFSLPRFGNEGYRKAHPLLTFRCLPNIPAYHVSANFNLQGPYYVSYPGAGQVYQALDEAVIALQDESIDVAILGAVAHQRNFLVEHQFSRVRPPVAAESLADCCGVMVLERDTSAHNRKASPLATLEDYELTYEPFDVRKRWPIATDARRPGDDEPIQAAQHWGPTGLLQHLDAARKSSVASAERESHPQLRHDVQTMDGFRAHSRWSWAAP